MYCFIMHKLYICFGLNHEPIIFLIYFSTSSFENNFFEFSIIDIKKYDSVWRNTSHSNIPNHKQSIFSPANVFYSLLFCTITTDEF